MSENFELNHFSRLAKSIFGTRWHYFKDHVENFTPFIRSVYSACIDLGAIDEDAPLRMLREIRNIGGRKNFEPHYDQLMQKLAEILVMRQGVTMPWPQRTSFEIEAGVAGALKRIDLVATLPDGKKFGFEVKAPQYTPHARQRSDREFQAQNANKSDLPRDNTLRSFLRSANEKFEAFAAQHDFCGILVIVWDDWVFEAIDPLLNSQTGLLTPASYSLVDGTPETFKNVDTVLILRHLTQFVEAAREHGLSNSKFDVMHIGGSGEKPNLIKQMSNAEVPEFVKNGFNAVPLDRPTATHLTGSVSNQPVQAPLV